MSSDRRGRPNSDASDGNSSETGDDTEDSSGGNGKTSTGGKAESRPGDETLRRGRRDVVVPRELYKVVTVFSTLIAIVAVVGGFVLLDTATNRTLAAASEVNLPLAIGGVGLIVLGAATYAFAARFRTQGMGSPNNDADGESGNG